MTPDKQEQHAAIRKTVERAIPSIGVDETKVLTDEELATLRAQTAERVEAQKLAQEQSRGALRRRLSQAVETVTEGEQAS